MNTNQSDNRSDRMLCPKCKITHTIEHNDGQWCPRCGSFAIPPDPRHTAHIQTERPSRKSAPLFRPTAGARVAGPRCARCGERGDTGDAIYEDGEWLCGACIAGLIR